jgi:hypothetical protein
MNIDDFYDKLRGRKYVYYLESGLSSANVLACDENHARYLGKKYWSNQVDITYCQEVTNSFKMLNNTYTDEDGDKLEPGILSINFQDDGHKWVTSR